MGDSILKITGKEEGSAQIDFFQMLESAPVNVMYADRDFFIRYVNKMSRQTLKKIEHLLPIKVDAIVGSNIDIFHKNPAHQRKMLANERNLPHRTVIQLGDEKLELLVTAIHDKEGNYVGTMVNWDIVTEKIRMESEMARIKSMMDNAPINIMACDRDFKLVYMNPKSRETLKRIEKLLPMPVDRLVGQSIDIFHKKPEVQRTLLANDRNLPHRAKIKLGDETLDLLASAMYDHERNYMGPMVT